jgi:hypothetical protein
MVTGFDIKLGDANTIAVGSVSWKLQDPQCLQVKSAQDAQGNQGTYIGDN